VARKGENGNANKIYCFVEARGGMFLKVLVKLFIWKYMLGGA